jgi:hypothetical protein
MLHRHNALHGRVDKRSASTGLSLVDALRLSTLQNTGLIDSALKSLKPFALSKGQFIKGLRLAQPERS